jgi:hypothetical protein
LEKMASASRMEPSDATVFGRLGWRQLQRLERSARWRHLLLDEREIERDARVDAKAAVRAEELAQKRAAKLRALVERRAAKDAERVNGPPRR